jgi:hypothetical protein
MKTVSTTLHKPFKKSLSVPKKLSKAALAYKAGKGKEMIELTVDCFKDDDVL